MNSAIKNILILVLTVFIINSCTSVKTRTVKLSKTLDQQSKSEETELQIEEKKSKSLYKNRFEDTTIVKIEGEPLESNETSDKFNKALQLFDDGNFKESYSILNEMAKSIETPNQKYYEIQFYISECKIQFSENNDAEEILKKLTENSSVNQNILEKAIVRLGQLYCIMDKKEQANSYFQRLKREFPKSQYLHFADCNIIK